MEMTNEAHEKGIEAASLELLHDLGADFTEEIIARHVISAYLEASGQVVVPSMNPKTRL